MFLNNVSIYIKVVIIAILLRETWKAKKTGVLNYADELIHMEHCAQHLCRVGPNPNWPTPIGVRGGGRVGGLIPSIDLLGTGHLVI